MDIKIILLNDSAKNLGVIFQSDTSDKYISGTVQFFFNFVVFIVFALLPLKLPS